MQERCNSIANTLELSSLIIMLWFSPKYPQQIHHSSPLRVGYATPQIARFMGPTWGPSGADKTQVGPMLAPWTLVSGIFSVFNTVHSPYIVCHFSLYNSWYPIAHLYSMGCCSWVQIWSKFYHCNCCVVLCCIMSYITDILSLQNFNLSLQCLL